MSRPTYTLEVPDGRYQPPGTFASRAAATRALRLWLRLDRLYVYGPVDSEEEVRDWSTGEYRVVPTTSWLAYPTARERAADQDGAYAPRIVRRRH